MNLFGDRGKLLSDQSSIETGGRKIPPNPEAHEGEEGEPDADLAISFVI